MKKRVMTVVIFVITRFLGGALSMRETAVIFAFNVIIRLYQLMFCSDYLLSSGTYFLGSAMLIYAGRIILLALTSSSRR